MKRIEVTQQDRNNLFKAYQWLAAVLVFWLIGGLARWIVTGNPALLGVTFCLSMAYIFFYQPLANRILPDDHVVNPHLYR